MKTAAEQNPSFSSLLTTSPHLNSEESPDVRRKWPGCGRQARFQRGAGPPGPGPVYTARRTGRQDLAANAPLPLRTEGAGRAWPGAGWPVPEGKVKCKERFLPASRPQTFVSSLQAVPPVIHNQRELINKPHLGLAPQPGWDLGGSEVGGWETGKLRRGPEEAWGTGVMLTAGQGHFWLPMEGLQVCCQQSHPTEDSSMGPPVRSKEC